ncbi:MAG TPA: DUF1269 domain-containing protein [Anaerolineae bacterium]|nr:DUF1269 domain-containing protein [Anaerolineae bacterium]HIP73719.1 DUF1269 domain-containing protein [Anaerolineae bacterium]
MSNNLAESRVVIAFYNSEIDADGAVDSLKRWDDANKDVKLGTVGTIFKKDGKIKTKVGHKSGKWAKVGVVLGIIAGVLSGGVTVIGGAVVAGLTGGVLGAFFKKSTNLTKDEINKIGEALDQGQVAVIVTCDQDELEATSEALSKFGGTVQSYEVDKEALTDAAKAMGSTETATTDDTTATEAADDTAS